MPPPVPPSVNDGPDDRRQADVVERGERLRQRLDLMRARRRQTDAGHGLAEQLAVFRHVDGVGGGADHLDVEFLQHAHLAQRQRAIERGLPAHGGKQRVGTFALDDLGDDLRRDRLDVGGVGEVRIGHDRRRIGIDQDDPVAFLLERLAGLRAGIVEFAGLADDDRAGADDHDRFDVGAFGHRLSDHWTQKKGAPMRALPRTALRPSLARGAHIDPNRRAGKGAGRISGGRLKATPAVPKTSCATDCGRYCAARVAPQSPRP